MPRPFVVAMNRVDVVELVVDLDADLVDVDLAVSLCDGPRSVLFSFGLVAPTCFIYFWPPLVFSCLAPTCFIYFWPQPVLFSVGHVPYLLLAPTCFIFCWPRLVLLAFGPDMFYFSAVFPASWYLAFARREYRQANICAWKRAYACC